MADLYFGPGDQGLGVEAVQTNLRSLGYNLAVDGIYGSETEAAVRSVQAAASITVDGLAGAETQAAISRALVSGWRTNDPTPWDGGSGTAADASRPTTVAPSPSAVVSQPKIPQPGLPWIPLLIAAGVAWWIWKTFIKSPSRA